jgi:hypothetical protein
MAKISDNIRKVKLAMLQEVDSPDPVFGRGVQQKALHAVSKGQGSTQWETYMKMFVDNEGDLANGDSVSSKQLARLTGKDDTGGIAAFDEVRAYLAADGTCTTDTSINFGRNAGTTLDDGVPVA